MNDKFENIDFEILTAKYMAGEASPEEKRILEEWVKASDVNKKLFLDYKHSWNIAMAGKMEFDKNKAWSEIERKLFSAPDTVIFPTVEPPVRPSRIRIIWRIAASVSVFIAVGFLLFFLFHNPDKELVAENEMITKTLKDGTEITLNQNAKLIYPKRFSKDERKVTLEGDAFFKVARDEKKPFVIETDDVEVKVLGTAFYVDARPNNKQVEVVVKSGKVSLRTPEGKQIVLVAGEKGIFIRDQKALYRESNNDKNYLAWKTRKISFEDAGIDQVALVLEKTYHVSIKLENSELKNCSLTATFDNQSLEDVLTIIEETLDLKASRKGNSIVLSGKGCD